MIVLTNIGNCALLKHAHAVHKLIHLLSVQDCPSLINTDLRRHVLLYHFTNEHFFKSHVKRFNLSAKNNEPKNNGKQRNIKETTWEMTGKQ